MTEEYVILVDQNDRELGYMPKNEAHLKAQLHRAISVFVLNDEGHWLLQRRALTKYHSAGLWTNTCCTHPLPNESNIDAASRRLQQEMGMQCELREIFHFIYKEQLDNQMTEYELDHVFIGYSNDMPQPNTMEVMEYKYIPIDQLISDIEIRPMNYTVWFKKIVKQVASHILELKQIVT